MDITKWEYTSVSINDENKLQELGKQGWEGISSDNGTIVLKRPCGRIQVIEKVNTTGVEIKQTPDFNLDQNKDSGYGY